jgi:hypothetical protein
MPNRLDFLAAMLREIEEKYDCAAVHRESVDVHEMLDGNTIWKGRVEIFDLTGHAEAIKCYAWAYRDKEKGGNVRLIIVLASHLVDSAQKAVRAAIFYDVQPVPIPDEPPRTDAS